MAKTSVLTPQGDDFPRWYQDVVAKAELAENGPVRGTMVIRPYGWSIWERMQRELDDRIKSTGARNASARTTQVTGAIHLGMVSPAVGPNLADSSPHYIRYSPSARGAKFIGRLYVPDGPAGFNADPPA